MSDPPSYQVCKQLVNPGLLFDQMHVSYIYLLNKIYATKPVNDMKWHHFNLDFTLESEAFYFTFFSTQQTIKHKIYFVFLGPLSFGNTFIRTCVQGV